MQTRRIVSLLALTALLLPAVVPVAAADPQPSADPQPEATPPADDDDAPFSGPGGNCPTSGLLGKIDGVTVGVTYDLGELFGGNHAGVTIAVEDDHSVAVEGGTVALCLKAGPGHTGIEEVHDDATVSVADSDLRVGAQGESIPAISNIAIYAATPAQPESDEDSSEGSEGSDGSGGSDGSEGSDGADAPIVIEEEPKVLGVVVDPQADISAACVVEDGAVTVDMALDNQGSTTEVEYTLALGDEVAQVVVAGLDAVVRSEVVEPDDGDVEVVVTAADDVLASRMVSVAEECDTGVLGVVEDEPDAAAVTGPQDTHADEVSQVAVQGETVEGTGLPRTGASALLLALAGVVTLLAGGGLLATRRTAVTAR